MRFLIIPLAAWVLGGFPAQAQNYFLDSSTSFVRGVVSVETSALSDPVWQVFAARNGVLLADTGHAPAGRLANLAAATGHPEVAVAPFVPFGLSANGRRALETAIALPDRCIAVIPQRPGRCFAIGNEGFNFNRLDQTVTSTTLFDFAPAFPVPVLFLAGELDNLSGTVLPLGNFEFRRRSGDAPWAYAVEPDVTHTGVVMPPALITTYLEGILQRRLPAANWASNQAPTLLPIDLTTGWLADPTTREVAAWADFAGDKSRAAWLPDEATAQAWVSATIALPYALPAQPIVLPATISNLQVLDPTWNTIHPADEAGGTSGGASWKVCGNLKEGDQAYVAAHGPVIFSVPDSIRGADWIRPIESVRTSSTDPLLRFNVTADATVLIAHDTAITTKPAWLSSWTDTGEDITLTTGTSNFDVPRVLRLYSRDYLSGSTVELGPNGGTNNQVMYLTVVKSASSQPSNDVFLVASDATASEAGLDAASITFTRSGTSGDLTVLYSVGGTAVAGSDFSALSGSIVIPDGQSSASLSITPLQDSETEGTETVIVTLQADPAYTLGNPSGATISILDDDGVVLPSVSVSASASSVTEGPSASVVLTLTRTGDTTDALPVTLSVTGDAGYGTDYTDFSLNQSIPAGSATLSIPVAIADDGVAESTESLVVTVLPTSNYTAGSPDSVTVTLSDPVAPPPGIDPTGIRFPAGSVIDVVAQYPGVVPDDGIDDTAALQQALDQYADSNRVLWLRDGVYHISDTLQFTGNERFNTLQGQSRDGTIIRLLPNSAGFGSGEPAKPMFYVNPGTTADRFQNELYDLTFDTGSGNPAATGVHFISNNQGGIRNLRIVSTDPASSGVGLDLANGLNGPLLVKDVVVEGFRVGIQAGNALNSATLENITLRDQLEVGFRNVQQVVTIRGLTSEQSLPVPALINGEDNTAAQHWFGLVTLVDSTLLCTANPAPDHAIISVGNTCAHNIEVSGYNFAARQLYGNFTGIPASDLPLSAPGIPLWIKAYNSTNPATFQPLTFDSPFAGMPGVEVLETPDVPWDDPPTWVNVADFATGDGSTDDTAGFQAAIDSMKPGGPNFGRTTLFVPAGLQFRVIGTVDISGPVRRIIGLKGRILGQAVGRFRLVDSPDASAGDAPIVRIERLNGFSNQFYIEHASRRTLVVANTTGARMVGNGRGDFFIEDVVGGNHSFTHPWQRVWARQFNAENSGLKIDNSGAVLWMLGLKTERSRTVLQTRDGGISHVVGGFIYRVDEAAVNPDPMFQVTDASGYFFGVGEYDATGTRHYTTILTETRGGETRSIGRTDFTSGGRHNGSRVIYLTNAAALDAPPPFTIWSKSRQGSGIVPDPTANADGDTLDDLLEYILDGDPLSSDPETAPRITLGPDGDFQFRFSIPTQGRSDASLSLETASGSLDASAWATSTIEPILTPDPATGQTSVVYPIPASTPTPFFLRLRGNLVGQSGD